MINTVIGTKVKMTQAFYENKRVPVSIVSVAPNVVSQVLDKKKHGYWGLQIAAGNKKAKNTSKPLQGHLKKSQTPDSKLQTFPRYLKEVRLNEEPEEKVGDVIQVQDIFSEGDMVQVTGISKGKGFAGGVKRWGFAGGPRTHGQSDRHRAPGSIGQGTDPGRVHKGKKMAGRMGGEKVTVKNLKVLFVDSGKNEIHLSGPVPGSPKSLLIIKKLIKAEKENFLDKPKEEAK